MIVVGVDGSEHGKAALRFAREEARLRDARLVALHAWTYVPPAPIAEPGMIPLPAGDLAGAVDAEQAAAVAALDDAIVAALGDDPGVGLERRLVEEAPGAALVAASHGADLVVVGTRGRGGLTSALLGSVSHDVVQHAACPVVIVRAAGHAS